MGFLLGLRRAVLRRNSVRIRVSVPVVIRRERMFRTWSQLENFVHFMEIRRTADGRPLPRPKDTTYNPQQGCPVAQQKGGFGGAGAGVDAHRVDIVRVSGVMEEVTR